LHAAYELLYFSLSLIYICVYISIYLSIYLSFYLYTYIHTYIYIYMFSRIRVSVIDDDKPRERRRQHTVKVDHRLGVCWCRVVARGVRAFVLPSLGGTGPGLDGGVSHMECLARQRIVHEHRGPKRIQDTRSRVKGALQLLINRYG